MTHLEEQLLKENHDYRKHLNDALEVNRILNDMNRKLLEEVAEYLKELEKLKNEHIWASKAESGRIN